MRFVTIRCSAKQTPHHRPNLPEFGSLEFLQHAPARRLQRVSNSSTSPV
jgi:hypothetical protein